MTEMTINVPSELAERLRPYHNRIPALLERWVKGLEADGSGVERPYKGHVFEGEINAFIKMHSTLVDDYLGQNVAIYQGELVDHDHDVVALLKRVRAQYGSERVLIREVEPESDRILNFPSFRLTDEPTHI